MAGVQQGVSMEMNRMNVLFVPHAEDVKRRGFPDAHFQIRNVPEPVPIYTCRGRTETRDQVSAHSVTTESVNLVVVKVVVVVVVRLEPATHLHMTISTMYPVM